MNRSNPPQDRKADRRALPRIPALDLRAAPSSIARARIATLRLVGAAAMALMAPHAFAADAATSAFGQIGAGDRSVQSVTLGATHSFRSDEARASSRWDVYGEVSVGRWRLEGDHSGKSTHATQIGFTPVVRYAFGQPKEAFFVEAGIGVNGITPIFHSDGRAFSTTFNFGDHVGFGKRFGVDGENELALRIQHYSNAGIKHPNPGEDFVQLRFAHRF